MTTTEAAPADRPKFDNQGQYSRTSILRYEKIFGEHTSARAEPDNR